MNKKLRALKRRGVTAFQTAFIFGVIGAGVMAGGGLVGNSTNSGMTDMASDVANPADLADRFQECDE